MSSISGIASILNSGSVNQMTMNLIKERDTNVDEVLSIDEAGSFKDVFSKIDTDGDGQVTADELNTAYFASQVYQTPSSMISSNDTNGDGTLSIDELGISQDNFSKIDTNSDGRASSDELNAAHPLTQYQNTIEALQSASINNISGKIDITS